jgi:cell division protein FtsZ
MINNTPKGSNTIIKVLGVGGGGSNAVNYMYKQGIVGVDFAICNTDAQAMENSPVPTKIQLGPTLTEGRGAGSKPAIGRESALESIEDVKAFFSDGTKMLFITAGMGGGTGTGAAPVIAKAAQEMDILTVAIVTLPFSFEGRSRISQGGEGLAELKKSVDTIIVISNDKLRQIHGNLSMASAFGQADSILTMAAKGIAEIITVPGYVNVDFEDVNTVMRGSGAAVMGTAITEGSDRAIRAAEAAILSPLLEDSDIQGAQHVLVNITSGKMEATMDEVFMITEYIQNAAGEANLIWGNCYDETLGDKLGVTVIATGFEQGRKKNQTPPPTTNKQQMPPSYTPPHYNNNNNNQYTPPPQVQRDETVRIPLDADPVEYQQPQRNPHRYNPSNKPNTYDFEDSAQMPFMQNNQQQHPEPFKQQQVLFDEEAQPVRTPKRFTSSSIDEVPLSDLENIPAYKRKGLNLDTPENGHKEQSSRNRSGSYRGYTDENSPNNFLFDIPD